MRSWFVSRHANLDRAEEGYRQRARLSCRRARLSLRCIGTRAQGEYGPGKKQTPRFWAWGFGHNLPDDVLLSRARCSLSSALKRFTVLFGMGRSGSTSLWSSGMTCRQQGCPASQSGKRSYRFQLLDRIAHIARGCDRTTQSSSADFLQSYRVKPHGQLVLVSLTCHHASTPSLSTSWSRTTLQGDLVPREISSLGEFPA